MTDTRRNLKLNGESLSVPTDKDYLLYTHDSNNGVPKTQKRVDLPKYRPLCHGHKKVRSCKDMVYRDGIKPHLEQYKIRGRYLGLAAAYAPEIYTVFKSHILQRFVNCQFDKKSYKALKVFNPKIQEAYKSHNISFELYEEDIFDRMKKYPNEYSILDLDFMCKLNKEFISKLANHAQYCVTKTSTMALWHFVGRSEWSTDYLNDTVYRPFLRQELKKYFYILKDDQINYSEGQHIRKKGGSPMRVEILTLRRKKACKKVA